jgi:hypothetical protein
VPEPNINQVVVFEDYFVVGLCMPPHPALAFRLLHLAVASRPQRSLQSTVSFHSSRRRSRLVTKPLVLNSGVLLFIRAVYGDGAKLMPMITNKWSTGWTKA